MDYIHGFTAWWDYLHNNVSHDIAIGEAAGEIYSKRVFSYRRSTVFAPLTPQVDTKFFDPQNLWYRFDSHPLKKSLERFAKFPIVYDF